MFSCGDFWSTEVKRCWASKQSRLDAEEASRKKEAAEKEEQTRDAVRLAFVTACQKVGVHPDSDCNSFLEALKGLLEKSIPLAEECSDGHTDWPRVKRRNPTAYDLWKALCDEPMTDDGKFDLPSGIPAWYWINYVLPKRCQEATSKLVEEAFGDYIDGNVPLEATEAEAPPVPPRDDAAPMMGPPVITSDIMADGVVSPVAVHGDASDGVAAAAAADSTTDVDMGKWKIEVEMAAHDACRKVENSGYIPAPDFIDVLMPLLKSLAEKGNQDAGTIYDALDDVTDDDHPSEDANIGSFFRDFLGEDGSIKIFVYVADVIDNYEPDSDSDDSEDEDSDDEPLSKRQRNK